MTKPAINQAFRYYNDKLGFGKIDSHRKFHPHGLRKFFATQLTRQEYTTRTLIVYWDTMLYQS